MLSQQRGDSSCLVPTTYTETKHHRPRGGEIEIYVDTAKFKEPNQQLISWEKESEFVRLEEASRSRQDRGGSVLGVVQFAPAPGPAPAPQTPKEGSLDMGLCSVRPGGPQLGLY